MIHSTGVLATVYSNELWSDTPAILAVMREDNIAATIVRHYTEPTCVGLVNNVVSGLCATTRGDEQNLRYRLRTLPCLRVTTQ